MVRGVRGGRRCGTETLPPLQAGHGRVRTLFSGISRGTERLVLAGRVPQAEWTTMRAPLQDGRLSVSGEIRLQRRRRCVEAGPHDLLGRTVFCLHPHQDLFDAPQSMLIPVPEAVPPQRATLAANMETALNAIWDSGAGPADRIAVIGAGVVGLLVGALAAKLPGATVTVCDIDPAARLTSCGTSACGSPVLTRAAGLRCGVPRQCLGEPA